MSIFKQIHLKFNKDNNHNPPYLGLHLTFWGGAAVKFSPAADMDSNNLLLLIIRDISYPKSDTVIRKKFKLFNKKKKSIKCSSALIKWAESHFSPSHPDVLEFSSCRRSCRSPAPSGPK